MRGLDLIKRKSPLPGTRQVSKGRIILATVEGDIHDIGKNIVKVVLENYGYDVLDLGRDVPVQTVVDAAVENDVYLIGLSALMTTTVPAMKATIEALREAGHPCKIMVGGAVMTPEYAEKSARITIPRMPRVPWQLRRKYWAREGWDERRYGTIDF